MQAKLLRVNALEALGRRDEAEALLKETLSESVKRVVLRVRGRKSFLHGNKTWDRLEQKGKIKYGWVRVGFINLPTGCLVPFLLIVVGTIAAIVYFGFN